MRTPALIVGFVALAGAASAHAECQLNKIVDLPVTMNGARPQLFGKINGHDTRFMVDSGAFWSVMSEASAKEYGLHPTAPARALRVTGIGGTSNAEVVMVDELKLGMLPIRGVQFVVAGSEVRGGAGVIGQNVLHYADVEYDLAHGRVGLFKPHDCTKTVLAYWSEDQPLSVLDTEEERSRLSRTIATIMINGKRVRALFDTGASNSVLSRSAATRLGIKLDGPGVVKGGFSRGFGSRIVPSWTVPIDDIKIGGEELRNNRLEVTELGGDEEMLVGADFFLAHRVYVANDQRKIYFTYLGGNFFNPARKNPKAVDAEGKALVLNDKAEEPTDAEGYSRRGMALASRGQLDAGLADLDKAVTLAPTEPRYLVQRAALRRRHGQSVLVMADLDHALALKPDDAEALLERARISMAHGDRVSAHTDVAAAERALDKVADARFAVASLYSELDDQAAAITDYTLWIDAHPDDASQPYAHNGRAWARALANVDISKALGDGNSALHTIPRKEVALDTRGLVKLRMGDFAGAVTDYDAALALNAKLAWSLYGRGLAKLKLGDKAGGEADIAAAKVLAPKLADRAAKYGLVP